MNRVPCLSVPCALHPVESLPINQWAPIQSELCIILLTSFSCSSFCINQSKLPGDCSPMSIDMALFQLFRQICVGAWDSCARIAPQLQRTTWPPEMFDSFPRFVLLKFLRRDLRTFSRPYVKMKIRLAIHKIRTKRLTRNGRVPLKWHRSNLCPSIPCTLMPERIGTPPKLLDDFTRWKHLLALEHDGLRVWKPALLPKTKPVQDLNHALMIDHHTQ